MATSVLGGAGAPLGASASVDNSKRGSNYAVSVAKPNWAKIRVFCDDDNIIITVFGDFVLSEGSFG